MLAVNSAKIKFGQFVIGRRGQAEQVSQIGFDLLKLGIIGGFAIGDSIFGDGIIEALQRFRRQGVGRAGLEALQRGFLGAARAIEVRRGLGGRGAVVGGASGSSFGTGGVVMGDAGHGGGGFPIDTDIADGGAARAWGCGSLRGAGGGCGGAVRVWRGFGGDHFGRPGHWAGGHGRGLGFWHYMGAKINVSGFIGENVVHFGYKQLMAGHAGGLYFRR